MEIKNVIFGTWFIQYEVVFSNINKASIVVLIEAMTFICINQIGIYVTRYKDMHIDNKRSTRWLKR